MGGFGNQMFQYAFGRHLSLRHQTPLLIDINFLLDRSPKKFFVYRDYDLSVFNLKVDIANKADLKEFNLKKESMLNRFKKINVQKKIINFDADKYYNITETGFAFNPLYLTLPKNVYLEGFWQCQKYFIDIEHQIREDFTFKKPLNNEAKTMADKIKSVNSVCINIRRGFVKNLKERLFHGFLGLDYINKAVQIIVDKVDKPHFFIFSDDIEWCKENIKIDKSFDFVEHNYAGEKFSTYLQLMILCNHFIIPNSSFAWWAAWLNRNPNKIVVAPKKYFRTPFKDTSDVIPEDWIRI
jgi:hypothetical protein